MIRLSRIVKDYVETGALNGLINLYGFVDEQTFLTKSAEVGVAIRIEAPEYECLDAEQKAAVTRRFEASLRSLDERFRVYQILLKRDRVEVPWSVHANRVVQQAITNRIEYLQAKADELYSLDICFVVLFQGIRSQQDITELLTRLAKNPRAGFRELLSQRSKATFIEQQIELATTTLQNKVSSFLLQLNDTLRAAVIPKQEAFRLFRRLLNFNPLKSDLVGLKHDTFLDFYCCDSTVECHRGYLRIDDAYAKVLSLKEPPAQTFAHLLRGLQEIPCNLIVVTEWKRESNGKVRKQVQSKRRHFHNSRTSMLAHINASENAPGSVLVDDAKAAQVASLGECLKELEIQGNYFGEFSLTIVLYGTDLAKVDRSVSECFKVFSSHDGILLEEQYNLLNAFLAVVPGNHAYNLRRMLITNVNYADLSFLFASNAGEPRNKHLNAEYLSIFETQQGTPYYLNLHYGEVGHTLLLGATGAGKSFTLNFLITDAQKYAPVTRIFDLGGSYENLTRLFEGSYLRLGMQNPGFSINPFCLERTPENHQFLFSFCKVLIESNGFRMENREAKDLYEQIGNLYEIDVENRRLFSLANTLPHRLHEQLQKWVGEGQYGSLFDNVTDNLTFATFQTFDFEGMKKYPEALESLLFYLLHRADVSIYNAAQATQLKLFVMDEAWLFFANPTIKAYIGEALKTWRKRNAAAILATQSGDDLHQADITSTIVEGCATKLFLSNPGMNPQMYRETFHLNETEAALIQRLIPKQQMLIKRPDVSKILNLKVDAKSRWLYLNSAFENEKRAQAFAEHGFEKGLEVLAASAPRN